MNKFKNLIAAGMIALGSFIPIKAKSEPFNISLDNNFSTKYMLWGIPFSEGAVDQVMLNTNYKNLTATLFANRDFKQDKFNEGDIFVDYTKQLSDKLKASVGCIYFKFKQNGNWEDCTDLYVGISANIPLNPSLKYHRLLSGFDTGNYVEGAVSKNFPINEKATISTTGKIGYNDKAFRGKSGLSHLEAGVNIPIQLTNKLSVSPNINCSRTLASDLENEVFGGVNVHYDF